MHCYVVYDAWVDHMLQPCARCWWSTLWQQAVYVRFHLLMFTDYCRNLVCAHILTLEHKLENVVFALPNSHYCSFGKAVKCGMQVKTEKTLTISLYQTTRGKIADALEGGVAATGTLNNVDLCKGTPILSVSTTCSNKP